MAEVLTTQLNGEKVILVKPSTFMNLSGKAIASLAKFYQIKPEEILVAHDELDLPPGVAKFKKGGGHGGHNGLRDTITKLEKMEIDGFEVKYFSELKEQTTNLISNIDFELQELESKINLIFSIQGHRLNEVMKTLTILSVIFIPLTFLAGIYGMNFENIPELKFKYSYFILLAAMVIITLISVWYFKRKKWF